MDIICKRLRDLREDSDLTQAQIATVLRIQRTQYQKYEKGDQPLPVRHLKTLADFYKTSADYILGRTNDPKPLK